MTKGVLLSVACGAVVLQASCLMAVTDVAFKEAKDGGTMTDRFHLGVYRWGKGGVRAEFRRHGDAF